MFCPKCSQQQTSEQMRFCSRCGFALEAVASLVVNDGAPPESKTLRASPRQIGVRQGTTLLFLSLLVGFVVSLLSVFVIGSPELFVPLTAGVLFVSGILRIAYAYMFEAGPGFSCSTIAQLSAEHDSALPAAENIPLPRLNTRRFSTSELRRPPSVTEHTTKLLDQE